MNISHVGIGTGRGLTFALITALKVAAGQQSAFTHYQKLAMRTPVQGECNLADGTAPAVGVFVDVSAKGDSCTLESTGFEWVVTDAAYAVGDIVTSGATGELVAIAGAVPTAGELFAGVWQVDDVKAVDGVDYVLIDLAARL